MGTFLLSLLYKQLIVLGISVTKLPSTGSPPQAFSDGSLVYDEASNRIISFGGRVLQTNTCISSLYSFSLTNLSWDTIYPESDYKPPGLSDSYTAIHSNALYVFFGLKFEGISCDIYKFDLKIFKWEVVTTQGITIPGRFRHSSTSFTYLDSTYVAIFGGLTSNGYDNELYL